MTILRVNPGVLGRQGASDSGAQEDHSILLLNPTRRLYHVQANRGHDPYLDEPEEFGPQAPAARKVYSIAGEAIAGEAIASDPKSGACQPAFGSCVAFGVLPIREEPNSTFASCYLVNAPRLNPVNPWTEADWNDHPEAKRLTRSVSEETRLLVATSSGKVLCFKFTDENVELEPFEVKEHPEVWRLLRNGCVVGQAEVTSFQVLSNNEQVSVREQLPLVNLSSFHGPISHQPSTPENEQNAGPLDFKWTVGSSIRIAVRQRPALSLLTKDLFDYAKSVLIAAANTWTEGTGVQFVFVSDDARDYHILVDLEPLPYPLEELTYKGRVHRAQTKISLPMSDLGTYATRRMLNEPTLYVGCPPGIFNLEAQDQNGKARAFASNVEYYQSKTFKHIVSHELGHALGLPHLHQHPAWANLVQQPSREKIDRLIGKLKARLNIDAEEQFLKEHFMLPWPQNPAWGDWDHADVQNRSPGEMANLSVMVGLPMQALLLDEAAPIKLITEPTEFDKTWVRGAYPAKRGLRDA